MDWRKIAKAAGEHGVRYRTNAALERFLSEIAATPKSSTLSEDLLEALSDMLEAFTNSECGEVDRRLAVATARAALARVQP